MKTSANEQRQTTGNKASKERIIMKKLSRRLIPNLGTLIILGLFLFAQAVGAFPLKGVKTQGATLPALINYQGRLNDGSGNPVPDGSYTMAFRLYSQATGGTPLWTELRDVTVSSGLFSVMLGEVTSLPSPFPSDPVYLGVKVGTDAEMTPREQLGSVPFALVASVPAGSGLPSGAIVMWSGSLFEIPDGWALCDGTNGTPDLTDRFILSVSASEDPGETGGSHTKTLSVSNLPSHTHSFTTDSAGAHSHALYISGSAPAHPTGVKMEANGDDYSGHISSAGAHTHSGTTDATGSGSSFDIRPKYYKLAFIMKLP